ncbi:aconitate hydratase AcnA [Streptomonospora sp. S1-112]|uniref:Aconitate hydratase n=1 Tax=Streptomonospora mangrovi TaxID=2883123 RepID=A0A9X3SF46_9ACTN|nr:aconitate hydratase AcnA [Streptomonospora mangrovi]MDA0564450.1 aconitate hydratase AcnA [Streptomonospora mangrovi]
MTGPNEARAETSALDIGGSRYRYVPLEHLLTRRELAAVPYSVRVLLENVARRAPEALPDVVGRIRSGTGDCEVPFHPNRIMLHDTTCLPTLADFAALRDMVAELGGDPAAVNPVIDADLTVDHSVIAEAHGSAAALERNLRVDFERNGERYRFIKWAERSLRGFRVVPPGKGIIHQVNMETLARVVWRDSAQAPPLLHPDALVATDSHTPMINAIGVLGWGVGGLQAQAALLGEPVLFGFPEVVGVHVSGRLREGVTATDLALTLTEVLRGTGVVDAFVEFFGAGVDALSLADRAAVANMAPEYGATCTFFAYDDEVADYLRLTGRDAEHRAVVDAYLATQGLKRTPASPVPDYDRIVELDLAGVEPSLAGPHRPDQRLAVSQVPRSYRAAVAGPGGTGSSAPAEPGSGPADAPAPGPAPAPASSPAPDPVFGVPVPEGAVAIAAITSCTNTANPALMIQAGLLARRARERGLAARPWVKASLSPGSRVVTRYLEAAGLLEPLAETGFHTVGFGCMTCIGNSGPLQPRMAELVEAGARPVAVLSGNRNFPGRVNPSVSLAYLASPPLVVAYALAGTVLCDLAADPLGLDPQGRPVYLRDLWPGDREVAKLAASVLTPEMFQENSAAIREGTAQWRKLSAEGTTRFPWDPESAYVRRPPYLTGVDPRPPRRLDVADARVLLWLGDDITTDHISPAGAIPPDSPAGRHLVAAGTPPRHLNQYSTRRSNHEVMLQGAFTNPAVANLLLPPEARGGGGRAYTADRTRVEPVYAAARTYREAGLELVVVAGRNYGAGSSRDWAAKAQALLGVRAVVAESFERIHRANLIGMGVFPLEFPPGRGAGDLGLTGEEALSITGLADPRPGTATAVLRVRRADGSVAETPLRLRIDSRHEAAYLRHGGTMPYVVRRFLPEAPEAGGAEKGGGAAGEPAGRGAPARG